ncbi:bifunctional 4-hydroxy-2-oxoglutarate aldolase/2-dehydro-3-deoxy-phosphogluconate aldolase [Haloechinothrix sp. LS1_15]|uniref:bifunctional 4-hydroxy-2-oxoglutarate aldolase/2-dehydro-3-deoxy-phosphogluconate aldolase n=1 Tax=Haloechinothrix sp. LS1_15 TaxID=2652248 RepID=UPI0029465314|nr:bifunctional 4-hydroxy-2-oxoglutarate aldolase/2-dehydro-3-deoxy-phosphogluconate aldolase [Haloechinothrix sp. LS1_15]MDV6014057.1 bifunctional 4-hydroxy-2-oxoglutarate aldolase/2-dehydro-3-deoxy-phosphogluconate aldolase [Haloechinothrix sp. LS1_15]
MPVDHPSILDIAPVIPVVALHDASDAVPLARALAAGGVPIVEVTLRTGEALEAIRRIRSEVPEITAGVGTVTVPDQVTASVDAGAQFLVSPGQTPRLLDAMVAAPVPFLPGVATGSEILAVLERDHTDMKFFPAAASGGLDYLKAVSGPLPQVRFCPTGGITPDNAPDYLAQPNVGCVGGSWVTPETAVADRDWARIERLAAQAAALRQHSSA